MIPFSGIWFISSCRNIRREYSALWNVALSGQTNGKKTSRGENKHMSRLYVVSLSPFEMATHELQCVMVWRRHAEHQTLQTIHFVHVVRHLCNTERGTCQVNNKCQHSHSISCTLLSLKTWQTSTDWFHMYSISISYRIWRRRGQLSAISSTNRELTITQKSPMDW